MASNSVFDVADMNAAKLSRLSRSLKFLVPAFLVVAIVIPNLIFVFFGGDYTVALHQSGLFFAKDATQSTRTQYTSVGACNTTDDPLPTGGASCTSDTQCNGANSGGKCDLPSNTCVCAKGFGKPDCSYARVSKDLAGGLQLGLLYVDVAGVGNFLIGRTWAGALQLVFYSIAWILFCVFLCVAFACDSVIIGTIGYILCLACLLGGFIWSCIDGAHILQCVFTDSNGYNLF